MTIEEKIQGFKTKLKVDEKNYPKQFNYLMKTANACVKINNWYVSTALSKMKADGITVFSSREELKKYSPRELRKEFTKLSKEDETIAQFRGIHSTARSMVFEHIEETYTGSFKSDKICFVKECYKKSKEIEENIKEKEKECLKNKVEFTEEMREEAGVFFNHNKSGNKRKKSHKPDEIYAVEGFPRFKPMIRHKSFTINYIKLDYKEKSITLPSALGSKKHGVPKLEGVKIFFYDHGFNPEGIDENSLFTFSYDGKDWWMSVKQKVYEAKVDTENERNMVLGIHLGIKNTACLSNGLVLGNLFDKKELMELDKRKKHINKLMQKNLKKSPLEKGETEYGKKYQVKSAKYRKLYKHQQFIDNKIEHIKDVYIKNEVAKIPFNQIKGIVFEGGFDVSALKRNKRFSSKLQRACIGRLRSAIIAKAENCGIEVKKADKYFPRLQLCSCCGYYNEKATSPMIEEWTCPQCGTKHDRNINAAINLAKLWGNDELLVPYKKKKEKALDKNKQ